MIDAVRAAISFLTTIPVGGDVENLRKNLWLFPYTAILIGLIISIPHLVRAYADVRFLAIVFYIAVEGINHIDGLADFGDALFAPKSRKKEALKDLKTGAGGIAVVVIYLILLYELLMRANVWEIILSQVLAKFSMLLIMFSSTPSWEGMAAFMMEKISARDMIIGFLPVLAFSYILGWMSAAAFFVSLIITFALKKYSERHLGGVNGDIIGSANCLTFVSALTVFHVIL